MRLLGTVWRHHSTRMDFMAGALFYFFIDIAFFMFIAGAGMILCVAKSRACKPWQFFKPPLSVRRCSKKRNLACAVKLWCCFFPTASLDSCAQCSSARHKKRPSSMLLLRCNNSRSLWPV